MVKITLCKSFITIMLFLNVPAINLHLITLSIAIECVLGILLLMSFNERSRHTCRCHSGMFSAHRWCRQVICTAKDTCKLDMPELKHLERCSSKFKRYPTLNRSVVTKEKQKNSLPSVAPRFQEDHRTLAWLYCFVKLKQNPQIVRRCTLDKGNKRESPQWL